jgi:O-antigen/teichoic acid export membrane protein
MAKNSRHGLHLGMNIAGIVLPLLAGVCVVPSLLNALGTTQFGALALGWALVGYFSVLDLGLGKALTHQLAQRPYADLLANNLALARTARTMMLAIGLLWMLLMLVLMPVAGQWLQWEQALGEKGWLAWVLLAMCAPCILWTSCSASVLEARQEFVTVNVVRIPMGVANFVAPWLASLASNDVRWVFASLLLVRIGAAIAMAWCARKGFARTGALRQRANMQDLLRFGGWMTLSQVLGPIMTTFDRFAIAAWVSVAAVTYYTVPFDVLSRLPMLPVALMGVLFPLLTHAYSAKTEAPRDITRTLRLLLVLWVPGTLAAALVGPDLLHWWVGADIAQQSADIWQWLLVGVAINGLAHVPLTLLQSAGRTDAVAKVHTAEVLPYCLALWWGLQHHGVVGAAVVWTLRAAIDSALLYACAMHCTPHWRPLMREPMWAGVLVGGMLLAIALV